MTGLVRYDAMCRAIDAAYEIDEVKAIHDQAAMLQAAARVAKNVDAETRAYEIRMRAARKAGTLSKKIEKARLSEVPDGEFETALATKSVRDLIDKPSPVTSDGASVRAFDVF